MRTASIVAITVTALLLAIVVICYSLLKSGDLSARKKPGTFERAVANYALNLSIPGAAKKAKNPVKATPDALASGTKYYSENCAVCHGNDGAGRTNPAKGLSPDVPDLRATPVQKLTDGEIFYLIRNGIRFTGMPGWDFQDQEIWKLVLVTRQLPKQSSPNSPNKPAKPE